MISEDTNYYQATPTPIPATMSSATNPVPSVSLPAYPGFYFGSGASAAAAASSLFQHQYQQQRQALAMSLTTSAQAGGDRRSSDDVKGSTVMTGDQLSSSFMWQPGNSSMLGSDTPEVVLAQLLPALYRNLQRAAEATRLSTARAEGGEGKSSSGPDSSSLRIKSIATNQDVVNTTEVKPPPLLSSLELARAQQLLQMHHYQYRQLSTGDGSSVASSSNRSIVQSPHLSSQLPVARCDSLQDLSVGSAGVTRDTSPLPLSFRIMQEHIQHQLQQQQEMNQDPAPLHRHMMFQFHQEQPQFAANFSNENCSSRNRRRYSDEAPSASASDSFETSLDLSLGKRRPASTTLTSSQIQLQQQMHVPQQQTAVQTPPPALSDFAQCQYSDCDPDNASSDTSDSFSGNEIDSPMLSPVTDPAPHFLVPHPTHAPAPALLPPSTSATSLAAGWLAMATGSLSSPLGLTRQKKTSKNFLSKGGTEMMTSEIEAQAVLSSSSELEKAAAPYRLASPPTSSMSHPTLFNALSLPYPPPPPSAAVVIPPLLPPAPATLNSAPPSVGASAYNVAAAAAAAGAMAAPYAQQPLPGFTAALFNPDPAAAALTSLYGMWGMLDKHLFNIGLGFNLRNISRPTYIDC